ncbi:hypothetical protein ACLF3G_02630 [Falsiroseomonas sp. HC035]|uniref:hypothetical protein n=1 Tax=Falsiroseomonas sp. HC035 TaxID=3390999 RepID=UPI003D310B45
MMLEKHVWLTQTHLPGGALLRSYTVEDRGGGIPDRRRELRFRIGGLAQVELGNMDSAAAGLVFSAMHERRDLVLHGAVSRRLLENLEEFQLAWSAWLPKLYAPIEIRAERETDEVADPPASHPAAPAIAAFSGGVDASFTVWRHHRKTPGRHHRNLAAVMLVQGFDIPPGQDAAFAVASAGARDSLDGTGLAFHTVWTNLAAFLPQWEMNFAAGFAACLHQFSGTYASGLLASDEPYQHIVTPWGSHPVTNWMLSSGALEVVTDGAGYSRTARVSHIADWPGAMRNLRVCWQGPQTGRNCCRCEKCIRTMLNFRAAGLERPSAFAEDVSDDQIRSVVLRNGVQRMYMREVTLVARANGVTASWLDAVEDLLRPRPPAP